MKNVTDEFGESAFQGFLFGIPEDGIRYNLIYNRKCPLEDVQRAINAGKILAEVDRMAEASFTFSMQMRTLNGYKEKH